MTPVTVPIKIASQLPVHAGSLGTGVQPREFWETSGSSLARIMNHPRAFSLSFMRDQSMRVNVMFPSTLPVQAHERLSGNTNAMAGIPNHPTAFSLSFMRSLSTRRKRLGQCLNSGRLIQASIYRLAYILYI